MTGRTWGIIVVIALVAAVMFAFCGTSAEAQPPPSCFGADVTDPRASDFADFLTGTEERDVIALGDGADQYFSWTGTDSLCGNEGADVLVGEENADEIAGNFGDDILAGMGGPDVVLGGPGADTVKGNAGDDFLRGGPPSGDERDDIYDGRGSDTVSGGPEDFWHRCEDGAVDPHEGFEGQIIPDTDCEVPA